MIEYNLTSDGSTAWFKSSKSSKFVNPGEAHISGGGTWGGGTITMEKLRNGAAVNIFDSGTSITYTADFDDVLFIGEGDSIRFTLSGSTSPDLDIGIS